MRLLLRLAGTTTSPSIDLDVEFADDATIGELADHLAPLVGADCGQTIDGIPRSRAVTTDGPRSGSTVSLVPASDGGDADGPLLAAPVKVVFLATNPTSESRTVQLVYGTNEVGGAVLHVGRRVELHPLGSSRPAVNGEQVLGVRRLGDADLLTTDLASLIIRFEGQLDPPPDRGPTIGHSITQRMTQLPEPERIDLPTPPERVRLPGFPILSAMVPLLMGAALWLATKSLAAALFVLFSFVFVLASGLESRREARADQRFRLKEFRLDLDETAERMDVREQAIRASHQRESPDPLNLPSMKSPEQWRIWERSLHDTCSPPLRVRLGRGRQPTCDSIVIPDHGRRELRIELEELRSARRAVLLPVIIDLDPASGLAIVGRGEDTTAVARWLTMQLATLLAPDQLRVEVLAEQSRRSTWAWTDWLPHTNAVGTNRSLLVVDGASESDVESTLAGREDDSTILLWLAPTRAAIPSRLGYTLELGPEPVLHRNDLALADVSPLEFEVDDMTEDEALPLARTLAPLTPVRSKLDQPSTIAALPQLVELGDVLGDRDLLELPESVSSQWQKAIRTKSLTAPVGRLGNGLLQLDMTEDGPHALVAGTTGAGKSEFLRSLIASLALHHGPDKLTFLLIDYKGGAAFRSLEDLPHTVGLITDLSPSLALRALTSLRAEVIRREEILASSGASDISELRVGAAGQDVPPDQPRGQFPALMVIVDEFATLATELPAFVDGLVDLAQRGRSLGIHLVLATQRPAGVITDSIRANTTLRIALRMAEPDDSRDVVESPDAALLPRSVPGRAMVRFGSARPVAAQFALSAMPAFRPERIRSSPLGERNPAGVATGPTTQLRSANEGGYPTQLELVLATTRRAAELSGLATPRRPWLPPLPRSVTSDELDLFSSDFGERHSRSDAVEPTGPDRTSREDRSGTAIIGLVDQPERQRRAPLMVDLGRDGGVLVLGTSGAGRTTALAAIGAAFSNPASVLESDGQTHVYSIDACGGGPLSLRNSAAQIEVIDAADGERVLRILRFCLSRIGGSDAPTASGGGTRTVLLVDGLGALEEAHQHVNRGEAMEILERIARDGRTHGVHLVIAAQRRQEVSAGLAASLGCQIQLRCASEDDALMAGLDARAASKDLPPGRGFFRGQEIQIAVPPSRPLGQASFPTHQPPRITSLAKSVGLDDLESDRLDLWVVPIGVDESDFGTAVLDLSHHHAIVAGPRRSGTSETLQTIAQSLRRSVDAGHPGTDLATFRIAVNAGSPSTRWNSTFDFRGATADHGVSQDEPGDREPLEAVIERAASMARMGRMTLVVVEDFPELLESSVGDDLERSLGELVDLASRAPLRLILSGEVESMSRSFSGVLNRVRSSRTGILLQPDPDVHGSLLHCVLPRRDELQWPVGRGWLVTESRPTVVQVAVT